MVNIYFRTNLLKYGIVCRGFLASLFYEEPLYCLPPLFFSNFVQPSPFLFLLPCFFDWMGDCAKSCYFFTSWHYGSTHVELWDLSTTKTLWCVLCNKASVYWGLTYAMVFVRTLNWCHKHIQTKTHSTLRG